MLHPRARERHAAAHRHPSCLLTGLCHCRQVMGVAQGGQRSVENSWTALMRDAVASLPATSTPVQAPQPRPPGLPMSQAPAWRVPASSTAPAPQLSGSPLCICLHDRVLPQQMHALLVPQSTVCKCASHDLALLFPTVQHGMAGSRPHHGACSTGRRCVVHACTERGSVSAVHHRHLQP